MPRSWRPEFLLLVVVLVATQSVPSRVEYDVAVVRASAAGRLVLASGRVIGPPDTDLRFALHSDSIDIAALFGVEHPGDSGFSLVGEFFTQRRLARSRRGLPLWEHDTYQRTTAVGWRDTVKLFPLGTPARRAAESLWVEIVVTRAGAGALIRPSESSTIVDSSVELTLEAVVRPRRAVVWFTLIRGDTASPPRRLDLMIDAAARTIEVPVGASARRRLEFALTRPEAPASERDRVLAMEADMVCLRVAEPGGPGPVRATCGRLNNVARRLALEGDDTLVATFVWPAAR